MTGQVTVSRFNKTRKKLSSLRHQCLFSQGQLIIFVGVTTTLGVRGDAMISLLGPP